jgi:hypothetical protein
MSAMPGSRPDLAGKFPCTRCGHDQWLHNNIEGCPSCKCSANASEAGSTTRYPGIEPPYRGTRILAPHEPPLHEWQRPDPDPAPSPPVSTYTPLPADEVASIIGEGLHTGLRKGTGAPEAPALHRAISDSEQAWSEALDYLVWGLDVMGLALCRKDTPSS